MVILILERIIKKTDIFNYQELLKRIIYFLLEI